jgi:hypothetical protein
MRVMDKPHRADERNSGVTGKKAGTSRFNPLDVPFAQSNG